MTYYNLTRTTKNAQDIAVTDEHGLHILTEDINCQAAQHVFQQLSQQLKEEEGSEAVWKEIVEGNVDISVDKTDEAIA